MTQPSKKKKVAVQEQEHQQERLFGLEPIVHANTLLVILGSFPGKASLDAQEYYALKRNNFWPIVGDLLGYADLKEYDYHKKLYVLKKHRVGLWDVYASCCRVGSLDVNISAGEVNDLGLLTQQAPGLRVIAHNGAASAKFKKITSELGVEVMQLPSTSPANASWSYERKYAVWREAFIQAGIIPYSYY